MGKRSYKLMVTKHIHFEQIVKAKSEKEALELFNEEDLYDTDSRMVSDIEMEEYNCKEGS